MEGKMEYIVRMARKIGNCTNITECAVFTREITREQYRDIVKILKGEFPEERN
jgi:hypothetical protein